MTSVSVWERINGSRKFTEGFIKDQVLQSDNSGNLVYELYFFDDRQLRELVARNLDGEIDQIYRGLVGDNAVTERIEEIQNHKCVQVVEDKLKFF